MSNFASLNDYADEDQELTQIDEIEESPRNESEESKIAEQ